MVFTERSRPAREAILSTARAEFSAVGFDRSTIRSVAAKAGVDPAMVMRYYGNKEGLFAAAVDVDLALPAPGDADELGMLLGRHFVELWEGERADGTLQILLRSASSSPDIAARIRAVFADQVAAWVDAAPRRSGPAEPADGAGLASGDYGSATSYATEIAHQADGVDGADRVSGDEAPRAIPSTGRTPTGVIDGTDRGRAADSARRAGRVATYVLGTALCRYILALPPIADLDPDALAVEVGSALQLLLDGTLEP